MATVEELQEKINELETRIVALERSLFGVRHGVMDTASARTVPSRSA